MGCLHGLTVSQAVRAGLCCVAYTQACVPLRMLGHQHTTPRHVHVLRLRPGGESLSHENANMAALSARLLKRDDLPKFEPVRARACAARCGPQHLPSGACARSPWGPRTGCTWPQATSQPWRHSFCAPQQVQLTLQDLVREGQRLEQEQQHVLNNKLSKVRTSLLLRISLRCAAAAAAHFTVLLHFTAAALEGVPEGHGASGGRADRVQGLMRGAVMGLRLSVGHAVRTPAHVHACALGPVLPHMASIHACQWKPFTSSGAAPVKELARMAALAHGSACSTVARAAPCACA